MMDIHRLEERNLHMKHPKSMQSTVLNLKAPYLENTLLKPFNAVKEQEPRNTLLKTVKEQEASLGNVLPLTGWLSHYSDNDPKVHRHFWKVDHEYVTLSLTENSSLLYKKIAVKDIISTKELKVNKNNLIQLSFKQNLATEKLYIIADDENQARNLLKLKNWSNAIKCSQAKFEQKSSDVDQGLKKKKALFHNCQFALDFQNATQEANKQLRKIITTNGGQISYILTRNTSFLLVSQDEETKSFKTHKSQKAISLGIPIVTRGFVEKCVKKGRLVDPTEFVPSSMTGGDFTRGKIAVVTKIPKAQQMKKFQFDEIVKYKLDSGDCPTFPKEFQVPKYAILVQYSEDNISVAEIVCVEVHVSMTYDESDYREFRVMVSNKSEKSGNSCYIYPLPDANEASDCYELLVERYIASGMKRIYGLPDEKFSSVVSAPLSLILGEIKTSSGVIQHQVARLVERIWADSLGELNMLLAVDPASVTLEQIRNALISLLKIENSIEKSSFTADLSKTFYKFLPHKSDHKELLDSIGKVAKKRELCQLLKDIVSVNETSWLLKDARSSYSQYTALKCALNWLDPMGSEYKTVKDLLPEKSGTDKFCIKNIFRVNCNAESMQFKSNIGNTKLLFHSSDSQNFVGIFSRGLLLPHEVTKELGSSRRDAGNLGAGIYFTDAFELSCQFTTPSKSSGSRLMLVNEVALGEVFETDKTMPKLSAAPTNFNSVKWVKKVDEKDNTARDTEYAVYNRNQQRMCFVIEFVLNGEEIVLSEDISTVDLHFRQGISEFKNTEESSQDQENFNPAMKKMTYGLVMESDSPTPKLDEVHVRAKIIDLVSEVIIFQAYINESTKTVEAKYVFPLTKYAAVCGFEAYINEKHVVGIVKEKEQAHKEYKEAVSAGQGAYLMDEEKPNVFSVSIGNIPPNARVVIKITYISELDIVNEPKSCVSFSLPGNISQLDEQSTLLNSDITQITTDSHMVSKGDKSSLILSVDMPYDIIDITSPSHKVMIKKTATKACVKLQKSEKLGSGSFNLFIQVAEIHVPRIWIEKLEPEDHGQVAMVTFFPEFDFAASDDFDCTILLDMSNSMGSLVSHVKYLSSLLIDLLSSKCHVKIVAFGSHFEENSVGFRKADCQVKKNAKEFIARCLPTLGGSDLLYLFNSICLMQDTKSCKLHNIFLFSDGRLTEEERLLKTASMISRSSKSFTRIFTIGVGDSPNSHALQSLSLLTGGSYEHFSPSIKTSWGKQLQNQLVNSKQPVLTDVYIDWCNNDDTPKDCLQVPEKMKCVFNGSRLVAFSFLPNCSQATLHANVSGRKFSTVITAHELCKITGRTLHRLAVKNIFKEHETGVLADDSVDDQMLREEKKSQIISLSIKYSVVSKFTSFIAIEQREKNEDTSITTGPTVGELLESSFIDIISEVSWGVEEMTVEETIENLLKKSTQIEASSILQARQLAKEAELLNDAVPKQDVVQKLLISARLSQLDSTPDHFSPWQCLEEVLLRKDGMVNHDTINMISSSSDSKYIEALKEIARRCWPDHCLADLDIIHPKLQPLCIGFYSALHNISADSRLISKHWEEIKMELGTLPKIEITDRFLRVMTRKIVFKIKKIDSEKHLASSSLKRICRFQINSELLGSQSTKPYKRYSFGISRMRVTKREQKADQRNFQMYSSQPRTPPPIMNAGKLPEQTNLFSEKKKKKNVSALLCSSQEFEMLGLEDTCDLEEKYGFGNISNIQNYSTRGESFVARRSVASHLPSGSATPGYFKSVPPPVMNSREEDSYMKLGNEDTYSAPFQFPIAKNQTGVSWYSAAPASIKPRKMPHSAQMSESIDSLETSTKVSEFRVPSLIYPLPKKDSFSVQLYSSNVFEGELVAKSDSCFGAATMATTKSKIEENIGDALAPPKVPPRKPRSSERLESEKQIVSKTQSSIKANVHFPNDRERGYTLNSVEQMKNYTMATTKSKIEENIGDALASPKVPPGKPRIERLESEKQIVFKSSLKMNVPFPKDEEIERGYTTDSVGNMKKSLQKQSPMHGTTVVSQSQMTLPIDAEERPKIISAQLRRMKSSPSPTAMGGISSFSLQTDGPIRSLMKKSKKCLRSRQPIDFDFKKDLPKKFKEKKQELDDFFELSDEEEMVYATTSADTVRRFDMDFGMLPDIDSPTSYGNCEMWYDHDMLYEDGDEMSTTGDATDYLSNNSDSQKLGLKLVSCEDYYCLDADNIEELEFTLSVKQSMSHPIFSLIKKLKLTTDQVQAIIISRLSANGHWKFQESDLNLYYGSKLIRLLSFSAKKLIVESGGKSLGPDCMSATLDMLLTVLFLDILKVLSEPSTLLDCYALSERWLKRMNDSYPSLYRRLELGHSWQEVSKKVLMEVSSNV